MSITEFFDRFARWMSIASGSWIAFFAAFLMVISWSISGFWFGFTDLLFQMVINTVTTIITFLMVFLIQHSQNRDTEAMQLKLDELIRAVADARDEYRGIESRTKDEVQEIVEKTDDSHTRGEHIGQ